MTLDSLPDLDTSGLCHLKTLATALTCWPYRNTALRDGARTSTRTSLVAKGRTASIHCRPAPPRETEALSSRTSRSRPWKRRSQAVRERKTSVLRACRGGNVRKRVNEKGRCNLRFAKRTSGAINARTEGDTACGEEEHRVGRGVKPDLGDAGSLRPAEHAAAPAAGVGGRGGRRVGPRAVWAARRCRCRRGLPQRRREVAAAQRRQRDDDAPAAGRAAADRTLARS